LAIFVALAIAILGSALAYHFSEGKSKKRKYIIWGITTMVAIAPFLSFSIGLTYAMIVKNGWAALIMWYLFPLIFIIGLIMLMVGIFKKKETEAI
jgi:cytochrome bd-type quinol oxidase subunit 2